MFSKLFLSVKTQRGIFNTYAEVELAARSARHEAPAIRMPSARRERILRGVRQLDFQLTRLYRPDPQFWAIIRTAGGQVAAVRTPRQVRHSVRVALQRTDVAQRAVVLLNHFFSFYWSLLMCHLLHFYRVHIPNHDGRVLGAGGQFGAIRGESAEPHLVAVVVENLHRLQWQLIPGTEMVREERNVVEWRVGLDVVERTALLLRLHGLPQQGLQPERWINQLVTRLCHRLRLYLVCTCEEAA